jgi:hypothetical protein
MLLSTIQFDQWNTKINGLSKSQTYGLPFGGATGYRWCYQQVIFINGWKHSYNKGGTPLVVPQSPQVVARHHVRRLQ